ncbi:hypothetical protein JW899_03090 [Candidatus Uhrbacteria bacterium]|nr:hypothetical protein [Candidatus Uhrbacteria bacterium]
MVNRIRSGRGGLQKSGVIGLLTVIILGVTVLTVGLAASWSSQTELLLVGDSDRGQYARQLASSCLDEALYRLKLDLNHAGGTVPVLSSECAVSVSGSGTERTLTATATDGDCSRTLEVTAELRANGSGNARSWYVRSWREVDP